MKKKGLLIVVFIAMLIVFDYIVPNVDISKRAVVIGIGLDEDEGKMLVSAQILSRKKKEIGFEFYSAKGDDFDNCVANLSAKVGAELSLAHTLCLVVGESPKAVQSLDKIAKAGMLSDSCYVFVAGEKAGEIVQMVDKSNMPIVKILRDSANMNKQEIGISMCNMREYLCDSSAVGGCVNIPIVEVQSKEQGEELACKSSLLVKASQPKYRLDDKANVGITLVESKVLGSSLYVPTVDTTFQIYSAKLAFASPSVDKVGLTMNVKATNQGKSLSEREREELSEYIKEILYHSLSESITHNLDYLKLGQKIKAKHPKEWKDGQDYLQNLDVQVVVKIVLQRLTISAFC